MSKKRVTPLLLIPVLFLFACQPTYLDGGGDNTSKVKTVQTVKIDKTRDIKGFSEYKELSILDDLGVNTLSGMSLENLRLNSVDLEYVIIKEVLSSLNKTTDKTSKTTPVSSKIKRVDTSGDDIKQQLSYSLLEDKYIYDFTYKRTFRNLEEYEGVKKTFDTLIHDTGKEYGLKEVVVQTPSNLNPITYQVYSDGLKHIVVNSTNDTYGQYVLNIRYIVTTNIDFYLKSEHASALEDEGVLSVDTLGQLVKTVPTSRLTENFIPTLSETLGIPLDGYLIEDRGVVQESTYADDLYDVQILSEQGRIVYARVTLAQDKFTHVQSIATTESITQALGLVEKGRYTHTGGKEITQYSDGEDTLVIDGALGNHGVTRMHFMATTESARFIEYQLLRGIGTAYMSYR